MITLEKVLVATDLSESSRAALEHGRALAAAFDTRHDPSTGEAWLHGRFTYMLYR